MTTGLQIKPHSRRMSGLAVAALSLVAAGAFAAGLTRQIALANGPSPFPPPQAPTPRYIAAPEATPAPDMQMVASAVPPRHRAKPAEAAADADADAAAPLPGVTVPPAAADAAGTDAGATAPDVAPPLSAAPAPAPQSPPDPDNSDPPLG